MSVERNAKLKHTLGVSQGKSEQLDTHVDPVPHVADFDVGIDPVLVYLADHSHVGDTVTRHCPCTKQVA